MNERLVDSFRDTLKFSESGPIRPATEQSVQNTRVYFEGFRYCPDKRGIPGGRKLAEIEVTEETTFSAARRYAVLGKTAVLNFANPEIPGGGVKNGAMAQEECLCRSSNLYMCISCPEVFQDYYLYNRGYRYYYTDRLIYTPGVTVFKNEERVPEYMPAEDWFRTDVITCAAPMTVYMRDVNEKMLKKVMKSRIKNIFEAAAEHHVQSLILGAFGCGAFRNPPRLVAKAFREVILENGYDAIFENIVFAIKKTAAVCPNLEAFRETFKNMPNGTLRRQQIRLQEWGKKLCGG